MEKEIFEMYCPSCGTKNRIRIDLASLSAISVECGSCHFNMPISSVQIKEYISERDASEKGIEEEEGLSIFQKFGLISIILFLTRYSLEYISNDDYRKYLVIGVFLAFIVIPFLRKIFFQVMLALVLSVSIIYYIANYQDIKKGKIKFSKATNDIVTFLFSFGPIEQIKGIISYESYGRYLSKVDPRNKKINLLASQLTKPCKDGDHLCEVSLLLRFVTNEISYREDPKGGDDYIKSPLETLKSQSGDCEDQTILLISLLESIGKKSYMIFTSNHAYALTCFDEKIENYIRNNNHREYIETYLPENDINVLFDFFKNHRAIVINKQNCYELEPTARDSWIGFKHNIKEIKAIYDPIKKEEVKIKF